jgi:hypothetical protein
MDSTILYAMMIAMAILMAILPFGVFMGLGSILGTNASDPRLLVTFILLALVVSYLTSFGSFILVQRANCGKIKNLKQIATNAGLALGIQALFLILAWLIPGLRGIVSNLMPPDLDPNILDSVGYSYFSFWASLFGTAVGGTLSGICT